MRNILIIGAGDFQLPIVQRASLNYNVLLAAPAIPKEFEPYIGDSFIVDVRNKVKILDYARKKQICGVITDQTDIAVRSVAYVAEYMGLPGIGYETGCLFTDKDLMRQKLKKMGVPVLPYQTVSSKAEALDYYRKIGGDVIIKPLDMQGSRGVQICRSYTELDTKYAEAARWSSDKKVIVERYATGKEFVVEGMALNYEFRNLCIGDTQYFNLPDAFAAKSRIFPTIINDVLRDRVLDLNSRIIREFGLKQGITHSEFIMDGDEIYLIETAARGGGVFISSDLIHLSCGLDTEKFLLDIATGIQKDFPKIEPQQCVCGYLAFYIPTGKVVSVNGVEEIKSLPYIYRNQLDKIKVGMINTDGHTDKTSRLALILSAPNRNVFDERAKVVKEILKVETITENGIEPLIWD